MQVYEFYLELVCGLYKSGAADLMRQTLIVLFIALAAALTFYLLRAFGLYRMAKNQGLKHKALAFIPFANTYCMDKLVGECNFFGQKLKRVGLYTMITKIVYHLLLSVSVVSLVYLFEKFGQPSGNDIGLPFWIELSGFDKAVYTVYQVSYYILWFASFAYSILQILLLLGLFKKYAPNNYVLFGVLSYLIPVSSYIVIFVLRNRKAVDYNAYMRAKQEAYIRRRQEYQNRYGNPYNQNPYTQNPYDGANSAQGNRREEDPFEEFSSDRKGGQNGNGEPPKNENPFDEFSN